MSLFTFQRSAIKDGYLVGEQSDDDSSDDFEKSRANFPESMSSIPRLLLIYVIITTCYSVLMTALFTRQMVKSIHAGPNIIYSKFCEHSQAFPG